MRSDDVRGEQYICHCLKITERDLHGAVKQWQCRASNEVMQMTSAGTACMACKGRIARLLQRANT